MSRVGFQAGSLPTPCCRNASCSAWGQMPINFDSSACHCKWINFLPWMGTWPLRGG